MSLYAFDGTWNYRLGQANQWDAADTNVVKFLDAYIGNKSYFEGVGSEPGNNTIMEILGGAFGAGARSIISSAYFQLAHEVSRSGVPKDLDVIGYSRGAALAVHFLNLIREIGVPDLKTAKKKRVYRTVYIGGRRRQRSKTMVTYGNYHKIAKARFLGLWDTVAAFGVPVDIGPIPAQKINLGYQLDRPEGTSTFHAMAMDENRDPFQITRMNGASETWFRGVHSNIGGNFDGDEGLSDITLMWMINKAKTKGLKFDEAALKSVVPDPNGKLRKQSGGASIRIIESGDRVHMSVDRANYPKLKWSGLDIDKTKL